MPAIITKEREGLPHHVVTLLDAGPFRFTFKARESDTGKACFVTIERAGTEAKAKATLNKLGWMLS